MSDPAANVGLLSTLLARLQERILKTAMTSDLAVGTAEARRGPLTDDERQEVAVVARRSLERAAGAQRAARARRPG
jgi:hypothetical protein